MMPDLGKYAVEVLLAYGVSLTLLTGLVVGMVARANLVAKKLKQMEDRT